MEPLAPWFHSLFQRASFVELAWSLLFFLGIAVFRPPPLPEQQ
jgi:hypothetical protein